jgi:hypothetical protein
VRVFRAVALVAGVAVVALLPLYGDVRPSAFVSHAEWARLMLRGLDLLADAPGVNDTAAQAFATLSGRDSRAWPADQYVRGQRVEAFEEDGVHRIRAAGGIGEAVYALGIARQGNYRLRFQVAGPAAAEAELTKAGSNEILRSFTVPAATVMGWIDAGAVHLDPGAYDATVLLPEGSVLEYVELAPPCLHPIEPRGGWKAAAAATTEDVAVTVLQALDLESELPPAAPPIEFRGNDLKLEDGSRAMDASAGGEGGFRGGPKGSRVVLLADIPETGLYTLSVFGVPGAGQRWTADACRQCAVCPSNDPTARWRVLLSGQFQKGPHLFSASLGPDSAIERIRLEQKKDAPADYVAAVDRRGLELSPAGPVSREKAEEARRFLERRRAQQAQELCGDILRPGSLVADLATTGPGSGGGSQGGGESGGGEGGGGGGGGGGTGGGGDGGGGGGVPPPVIPPLPPPSPVLPDQFAGK